MLFSVIVCTYNRADQLAVLLTTLEEQQFSSDAFEVLIIDNNSTDHTHKISKEYCNQHANWRYILEEKQGLSHARNRGWHESSAEYVAYIDDDCKAPPEWLSNAEKVARGKKPHMFGGPYYPFYQSERPKWLKIEYYSSARFLGSVPQALDNTKFLSGGNMFIKRALIQKIGAFDPALGMKGDALGLAEDMELQKKLRLAVPDCLIFSDPEVYVYHLVPDFKMKITYRFKRQFAFGQMVSKQEFAVSNQKIPLYIRLKNLFITVINLLFHITIGTILRDRKKYKYFQNYWFEHCANYFIGFGRYSK